MLLKNTISFDGIAVLTALTNTFITLNVSDDNKAKVIPLMLFFCLSKSTSFPINRAVLLLVETTLFDLAFFQSVTGN